MSTTPLNFLHGDRANLESKAITEGTVYVAKGDDKRAYMYVDLDGQRYDISAPNSNYCGVSSNDDPCVRTVACDDFDLEPGISITVLFTTEVELDEATLNVNNTGAVPIMYRNDNYSGRFINAGSAYSFVYINSQFHLIGDLDSDTVLYGVKVSSSTTNANKPIFIANGTTGSNITGLYNANKPITANPSTGSMRIPGSVQSGTLHVGNDSSVSPVVYVQGDYINWYGYSDWSGVEGDWYIYNNGDTLEIAEDMHYGGKRIIIQADGSIQSLDGNFYSQGYRLPRVYYGTSAPDDDEGEDGDIYIMYS